MKTSMGRHVCHSRRNRSTGFKHYTSRPALIRAVAGIELLICIPDVDGRGCTNCERRASGESARTGHAATTGKGAARGCQRHIREMAPAPRQPDTTG
jgi:hypothetical protein